MMRHSDPLEIRIRDPIHGTIELSRAEIAVVEHPAFQRLRTIKQLGMADVAFPGATHTRYAHGLGTMHIASRMFSSLAKRFELAPADERRLHHTLRLATLFHDLGHAPFSHSTEAFMPPVSALNMGRWLTGSKSRRATHEDYTLKLLTDSSLGELIGQRFAHLGLRPEHVAYLLSGQGPLNGSSPFVVNGKNWMPLLRQCVSSELDADRMDYLLRDSYFAGVPYGRYDHDWLIENLVPVENGGALYLGLNAKASFGFDDFLLSRYHMFMSVYFHHVPVGHEVMLKRFHEEQTGELEFPATAEGYLAYDDIQLFTLLRASQSSWAQRVVQRRAYRMLIEIKEVVGDPISGPPEMLNTDLTEVCRALEARGIDSIQHTVKGRLSKYIGLQDDHTAQRCLAPKVYIVEQGRAVPIEDYTPLYRRYAGAIELRRVYVDPDRLSDARSVIEQMASWRRLFLGGRGQASTQRS